MDVPVLFIIFNRKDISLKSIDAIKKAKPKKLYIACDGPRADVEGESQKVLETRNAVLDQINWDCELFTLFRDSNLGCQQGVYTAISWLFEHEEAGIILEDDCIAEPSFFDFVATMLGKYKHDQRIGMIAGSNPVADKYHPASSYIFSNYKSCWGWATWKRAWKNMRLNIDWNAEDFKSVLYNCGRRGKDINEWLFKIKAIKNDYVSAWDWQWYLSLAAQNQMCIYPAKNLITNIGFDNNATHTSWTKASFQSHALLAPYKGPAIEAPDYEFEELFYQDSNSIRNKISRMVPYSVKKFIKSLIH